MSPSSVARSSVVPSSAKPKLPKLMLPKFKGDVTTFQAFWDCFNSAVNNNPDLSAVDKFNYLRALLEGPAARSVQGLTLTAANYSTALEILQGRFGKRQQIISAHMDDLLKLPSCTDNKPQHLRTIYDKIYVNVRGLEALGISASQYGSFLIPVIMSKLSSEVGLQVARVSARDVWDMEDLLRIIKSEVEAREISETIKATDSKPPDMARRASQVTATALVSTERNPTRLYCIYCKGEHYSAACETVKDAQARSEILRKDGRCFLCLGKGHKVSQCTATRRCRHCKKKHHQSICRGIPVAETHSDQPLTESSTSTVATSQSKSQVLLQTARTQACSVEGQELLPVRVLLDGGSERSYVTMCLKERLHLKPLKRETLNLNTFGTEQCQKKGYDLVKIILKGQDGSDIEVSALTFPTICAPPATAVQPPSCVELDGLELADQADTEGTDSIDILIESDHYWDIVTGEVMRGSGPVAIHSRLGWLLSGPIQQNPPHVICNLALQGPYSTPMQGSQDELISNLQHFWHTESLGKSEQSSTEKEFEAIIRYDVSESRYVVSLPWTSLEISSNNYKECLARLNLLKARLLKDRNLLQEYNGTFTQ